MKVKRNLSNLAEDRAESKKKKKGRREHPPIPTHSPNPHLRCEEKKRLQKVSNIHTQKQTSNIIKDAEESL